MEIRIELGTNLLKSFTHKKWKGHEVINLHPRIQSFLTQKLGANYRWFFAAPRISMGGRHQAIVWEISATGGSVGVSIEQLETSIDKSREYQLALTQIQTVRELLTRIKSSPNAKSEEKEWGELIEMCLEGVQPGQMIWCDGQLSIISWGIFPKYQMEVPEDPPIPRRFPPKRPAKQEKPASDQPSKHPPQKKSFSSDEKMPKEQETHSDSLPPKSMPVDPDQPKIDNPHKNALDPLTEQVNSFPPDYEESTEQGEDGYAESRPEDSSGSDEGYAKEYIHQDASPQLHNSPLEKRRIVFFLLVIFVLIMIIFFLLFSRGCSGSVKVKLPEGYPEEPNILIPIDTSDLGYDQDSIRIVVRNRLNIATKVPTATVKDLAIAFKQAYPGEEYKIIYRGEKIKRIQVEVPAEEMAQLKIEIKEKLKLFDPLIWQEGAYSYEAIPSDPAFSYRDTSWYMEAIGAFEAWDRGFGDSEILIAVLDDGFDLDHPELKGKAKYPWNLHQRTEDVWTNPRSIHGTHVAGIALGQRDNNGGLAGIAADCSLLPLQVGDRNGVITTTAITDAILYAILHDADVINMSLGMRINPSVGAMPPGIQRTLIENSMKDEQAFWAEVFDFAQQNDVMVVLAGGNSNVMIGLDPMQRHPYPIKVSATDQSSQKANFSNYGIYSTISAPGVDIYSSIPGNQYASFPGTSMAAPIVSGAVGLIKAISPQMTAPEIKELLVSTALPLSDPIGPLLQLDQAILALASPNDSLSPPLAEACEDVQDRIDSLLQLVEQLQKSCPEGAAPDTMKMPETIEDLSFAFGRWKSTTPIYNDDQEEITIYFDFYPNEKGQITFSEPDSVHCRADLDLQANGREMLVDQPDPAICDPPPAQYWNYTFSCKADANGYAACSAQNKEISTNTFTFRLIQITN